MNISSLKNSPLNLKQGIGLIKTEFYKRGKLANCSTGTGFLIEQDIVLTCAHNLLSPSDNQICSRITFYLPTLKGGQLEVDLQDDTNCYFSNKNLFCKFNEDILNGDDQHFMKFDFAIVKLAEKVTTHSFIDLSKVDLNKSVKEHEKVILKGFPNNKQTRQGDGNSVYRFTTAEGFIKSYNQHNLTYEIESYPGNSGSPIFIFSHSPVGIHISYNKDLEERTAIALTKANIEIICKWIKQINEQEQYQMNSLLQSCRILPTKKKNSPIKDDGRQNLQLISEIERKNGKKWLEEKKIQKQVRTRNPKQTAAEDFSEKEDEFTSSFSHKQWGKLDFQKKHKQSKNPDRFDNAILSNGKAPTDQLQTSQRKFLAELILAKSKASNQQYFITAAQTYLTLESLAIKFYSYLGRKDQIEFSSLKDIANLVQELFQKLNKNTNQNSNIENKRSPQNVKKPKDSLCKIQSSTNISIRGGSQAA